MKIKDSYFSYFTMYFFYYASYALFTAFTSIYVLNKGYTSVDVSIIVSSGLIAGMATQPIIGYLSDRFNIKLLNTILLSLSALFGLVFSFLNDVFFMAIMYAIVFLLMNGVNPAIEKTATTSRFRYGTLRIWGTIGFAIGAQLAGLVNQYIGASFIYFLFCLTMLLSVCGMLFTKNNVDTLSIQTNQSNYKATLFGNKQYTMYLIIASIFYGTLSVSGTHIPAMLQQSGLNETVSMTVVSFAVLCEMPLVFFSHLFMDKMKNKHLLTLLYISLMVQFLAYGLLAILPIKIIATLLFKHTVGMTFIMTNLKVVRTIIPNEYQFSALSIVATLGSLSAVLWQFIGGFLITYYGYSSFYLVMLASLCIGFLLLVNFKVQDNKDLILFR
ncbi:MFS transporter [Granulicatella sp. zg-ZJ]|uniref:MFS transporter n=1 Tax=unclassified Granulicatella TaxID=2630493 RepID=UPI0013C108FE|nr:MULTISPECIES: MFS transporter [unclassified Granulicatella]NEW61801.1 MFS transporter [Granulicatella sp. zg-ZJ]NEW65387.1 MFS transporter [Granulicatella sp. zg-84]